MHREAMDGSDASDQDSPLPPSGWQQTVLPGGETLAVPTPALRHVDGQPLLVRDGGVPTDGRPVVLLVHGWCADGLTNWHQTFGPLEQAGYRPVAVDLPGHGGSLLRDPFSLRRCGELVATLARELAAEGGQPVLACGYSMGGPVLQLAQRHDPGCLGGVVYVATAARVVQGWSSWSLGAVTGGWGVLAEAGEAGRRMWGLERAAPAAGGLGGHVAWMARSCDLRALTQAGRSLSRYDASRWVHRSTAPAVVVCTTKDRAVVPEAQRELARLVGAELHELDAGHTVCLRTEFGPAIVDAVEELASRVATRRR